MLFVPAGANAYGAVQTSHGPRPATNFGATVTPGTSDFGAWASLVSATSTESYGILVNINSNLASNASRNSVITVGIDFAGGTSYVDLIPNLIAGNASTYIKSGLWYYFPVFVPAGSSLAVKGYSSVTSTIRCYAQLLQRPFNPSLIKKASYVDSFGVTANAGTVVTAGTTSEGAWTLLGTTTRRLWWWQFGAQITTADTSRSNNVYHVDVGFGDGTNMVTIIQDAQWVTSTAEDANNPPLSAGVEYPVPSGSSIYARIQCGGTAEVLNMAVYGAGG